MIECNKKECVYHQKDEPFCNENVCMQCPHCGKLGFLPDIALYNAEMYGSGINVVSCRYCSQKVKVNLRRKVTVVMTTCEQSDALVDDWGK